MFLYFVKNIKNIIFNMKKFIIEIYRKRINELLFAKKTLLEIIADYEETDIDDNELIETIKWKIESINKMITEIMDFYIINE